MTRRAPWCDDLDLGARHRGDAVFEEPARHARAQAGARGDPALLVGAEHDRRVVVEADELPALVVRELLVHLDVLAARQADDAARLVAVQRDLAILLLQADADPLRDEVGDDRADEDQDLQHRDDGLDREQEMRRDQVGARRGPQHRVERDAGRADRGAGRGVARAVGHVVLALVAGDPRLDEGVDRRRRPGTPRAPGSGSGCSSRPCTGRA